LVTYFLRGCGDNLSLVIGTKIFTGAIAFGDLREQGTSDRREEQGKQATTARLRQQPTSRL